MKFIRRSLGLLSLLALGLLPASAQNRVVVNDSIDALMKQGIVPVTVVSDDATIGQLVTFALSAHGAFSVRTNSSVRVTIGRTGTTAVVACDHPSFTFQTTIEARDQDAGTICALSRCLYTHRCRCRTQLLYKGWTR